MSKLRLDNMDNLEKQLADLQMNRVNSPSKVKKVPPAVPPKKKAQPQVPKSAVVNTICEPSYSMKITPLVNNTHTYSNMPSDNILHAPADYANVSHFSTSNNNMTNQYLPTPLGNCSSYNNMQLESNNDNLLPPPPPPPLPSFHITQSNPNNNNNIPHEEYLPPPSPVSSNYSELARATANMNFNQERTNHPHIYQNEYPEYGASQSSAYESLYEPISPHPQNQNNFTNHSIPNPINNVVPGKSRIPKEQEVDALTNLLVQSISDSQDLDVFGICVKCGEKVVGESSGCTAMGNMYHIQCFRCHCCKVNLQGKPFYAVEDQPYCEIDYYETLEKCSVCTKPILERILRATGKPYHPTCFTCVVCGKSLDGIPFTVDAMNQIHCIEDFHKKFAPRCCVCELPIMPEEGEEETVRVVALDRSFHVKCYRCEDCGLQLSSEAEGRGCYPLDDHILCKSCNAHRICLLTNTPSHVMTTDL